MKIRQDGDMSLFNLDLDALRLRTSSKWTRYEADVLPMFVAEMDVAPPPEISEHLFRAISQGDLGYPGLPVYQESFADFASWLWNWELDPAELQITVDVMRGIRELILILTDPGDGIVVNPPVYPPFFTVVEEAGRSLVPVALTPGGRLDLPALEKSFQQQRPKAMLLCSPHNPTGAVHTLEELTELGRLAQKYGVVVISDEIHAPLAGAAHTPFVTVPGAEQSVVVTSASKSWNLAALKAALIIPGAGATEVLGWLPGHVPASASHLAIIGHSAALDHGRDWLQQVAAEIEQNKQHLKTELARLLPGASYEPAPGTYLAWLDCSELGLEAPGRHFHEVGRVRFNFGTEFSPDAGQFVRMNLATSKELITEGVSRMAASLDTAR